jgi:zinc transporter ZupT
MLGGFGWGGSHLSKNRERGAASFSCSLGLVVIVFIPVAVGVPAVFVFVPPAVLFAPAAFAGCVQFVAFVIGLTAVASMALDGAMEFMFLVGDAALAAVDFVGVQPWRRSEEQESSGE